MVIHVVQPGESLWQIAQIYGVSTGTIINANALEDLPYLILGQSLVIPGTNFNYTVQSGDTLWLISQQFHVSVRDILANNDITELIYPGMVLQITQTPNMYGLIEVNGFIIPSPNNNENVALVNEVGQYLTYITSFSYAVTAEGTLQPLNDQAILRTAANYNVAPLLVITNYQGGNFNANLAHTILSTNSVQENLISNLLNLLEEKGYDGVVVDFEHIPAEDRQLYNAFLRKVTAALHAENYIVASALAPKTYDITVGPWHGAHDYAAHGQIMDFVIIMTYDWGWAGGPPYPIAPIPNVREVLEYAVSVIPPGKILMGVPFYGYDWTLPYVEGGPWARMVSYVQALQLAAQYGAPIQYNEEFQAPSFQYFDSQGRQHIVWFEDARSVQAKYSLVNDYGLRGVSYWVLNLPFPQNWPVLDFWFEIDKKS